MAVGIQNMGSVKKLNIYNKLELFHLKLPFLLIITHYQCLYYIINNQILVAFVYIVESKVSHLNYIVTTRYQYLIQNYLNTVTKKLNAETTILIILKDATVT